MRDENKFLGWRSRAGTHWRVAEECPGPGGERGPESVARPGRGPPRSCPAVPSSLHAGPVALGWGSAGCPQRNDKAGHSDAWQGPQAGRRGGKQEAGREKRAVAGGRAGEGAESRRVGLGCAEGREGREAAGMGVRWSERGAEPCGARCPGAGRDSGPYAPSFTVLHAWPSSPSTSGGIPPQGPSSLNPRAHLLQII